MKYENEILNEIKQVLDSIDEYSVDLMCEVIESSDKVVGYGAGRMGLVLKAFIMRLNHLGIDAYYMGDTYIPPLGKYDLVIVSSASGETELIKKFCEEVKKKTECCIGAVTGNRNSSIGAMANWVIEYTSCNGALNSPDSSDKIDSAQLMSTLNEQATYILFDIMIRKLMDKMELDPDKIKRNHFNVE